MKKKYSRRSSGKKKYKLYRPRKKRGFKTLTDAIKSAARKRGYRIKSIGGLMAKFVPVKRGKRMYKRRSRR